MNCTSGPALPSCSVSLVEQVSVSACTPGVSFGCGADNHSVRSETFSRRINVALMQPPFPQQVWTNNGCRGTFLLNGANISCNVNGSGLHLCEGPGGNVTCKGWISDLQKEILLNEEASAFLVKLVVEHLHCAQWPRFLPSRLSP